MDSLVAIGTGSAFLYSLIMTILIPNDSHHAHNLYYESAAVVVTLVMLGKYMEGRSKNKTSEAIRKLMELAPDTAVVVRDVEREHVRVVVPLPKNMEEIKQVLREEVAYNGTSVVIARRECIQTLKRHLKAKK